MVYGQTEHRSVFLNSIFCAFYERNDLSFNIGFDETNIQVVFFYEGVNIRCFDFNISFFQKSGSLKCRIVDKCGSFFFGNGFFYQNAFVFGKIVQASGFCEFFSIARRQFERICSVGKIFLHDEH